MSESKNNSHSGQARKIPATEARFLGTTTPASLPQGETTEIQKTSKTENAPESPRSDEQGGEGIPGPLKPEAAAETGADSEKIAVGAIQAPKNWVQRALAEVHERKKDRECQGSGRSTRFLPPVQGPGPNTVTGLFKNKGIQNERAIKLKIELRTAQALEDIARKLPDKPTDNDQGSGLPAGTDLEKNRHSIDYRSVFLKTGETYSFTPQQAACIKILWEAYENKTPEIGQGTLLEKLDTTIKRLKDVFKDHEAWGKIITPGKSKGSFRLKLP